MDEVKIKYAGYHDYINDIYKDDGIIDNIVKNNRSTFECNFTTAGWDIATAYSICMRQPDETYEENIDYLKTWMNERDN